MDILQILHGTPGEASPAATSSSGLSESGRSFATLLQLLRGALPPRRQDAVAAMEAGGAGLEPVTVGMPDRPEAARLDEETVGGRSEAAQPDGPETTTVAAAGSATTEPTLEEGPLALAADRSAVPGSFVPAAAPAPSEDFAAHNSAQDSELTHPAGARGEPSPTLASSRPEGQHVLFEVEVEAEAEAEQPRPAATPSAAERRRSTASAPSRSANGPSAPQLSAEDLDTAPLGDHVPPAAESGISNRAGGARSDAPHGPTHSDAAEPDSGSDAGVGAQRAASATAPGPVPTGTPAGTYPSVTPEGAWNQQRIANQHGLRTAQLDERAISLPPPLTDHPETPSDTERPGSVGASNAFSGDSVSPADTVRSRPGPHTAAPEALAARDETAVRSPLSTRPESTVPPTNRADAARRSFSPETVAISGHQSPWPVRPFSEGSPVPTAVLAAHPIATVDDADPKSPSIISAAESVEPAPTSDPTSGGAAPNPSRLEAVGRRLEHAARHVIRLLASVLTGESAPTPPTAPGSPIVDAGNAPASFDAEIRPGAVPSPSADTAHSLSSPGEGRTSSGHPSPASLAGSSTTSASTDAHTPTPAFSSASTSSTVPGSDRSHAPATTAPAPHPVADTAHNENRTPTSGTTEAASSDKQAAAPTGPHPVAPTARQSELDPVTDPMEPQPTPVTEELTVDDAARVEVGPDRTATARADAAPNGSVTPPRNGPSAPSTRAAVAWLNAVLEQPSQFHTDANGTSVLRLRIDEESGNVTLRARQEGERMVVSVAFTDAGLQSTAEAQGDEIRSALQQLFDSAVDLSFGRPDQSGGDQNHPESAPAVLAPGIRDEQGAHESTLSTRPAAYHGITGARHEWVG